VQERIDMQLDLKERKHLADRGIDGRIVLKWIIKKYGGMTFTVFVWLRMVRCGR
jgi:hypothetical protein